MIVSDLATSILRLPSPHAHWHQAIRRQRMEKNKRADVEVERGNRKLFLLHSCS